MVHLIALTFKMTCFPSNEQKLKGWKPEIIDLGAALVNTSTGKILENFHSFVKPTEFRITYGCQLFTGISNKMVETYPPLVCVLCRFQQWISDIRKDYDLTLPQRGLTKEDNTYFCTWTNKDLGSYLRKECFRKKISYAKYLKFWLKVEEMFHEVYGGAASGRLQDAVERIQFKKFIKCGRNVHDSTILAHLAHHLFHSNVMVELKYCFLKI